MPTTSRIASRTSAHEPRAFVVPIVRELPRPVPEPVGFATTW